jgi:hypothetical protein
LTRRSNGVREAEEEEAEEEEERTERTESESQNGCWKGIMVIKVGLIDTLK